MYTKRIINKIPGNVQPESKKEKQGYMGDLSQKTTLELKDLILRQQKILSNKAFVNKLADKGEKINKLKEAIEEVLKSRDEAENLSKMLSNLTFNGKDDMEELEWTGNCNPGYRSQEEKTNISEDEQDPLKILASHSGAGFHKKKHKILTPDESLIQPSDLEVEDELDEYAKHLCQKFDTAMEAPQTKGKFLPYKTLRHTAAELKGENSPPDHKLIKGDNSKKTTNMQWEVTAATPPPPVHGDTKMVTLQESMKLQFDQQQNFKLIQMQHAAERLGAYAGGSMGVAPAAPGKYREQGQSSSDELSESEEVHDDEPKDGGGVFIYNLIDDTNDD